MLLGLIKNEANLVDIIDRETMTFSYVPLDSEKEIAAFGQFLAAAFPDIEIVKTQPSNGRLFVQIVKKK